MSDIVQYIVVRADLTKTLGFTLGAFAAQVAHAAVAAVEKFRDAKCTVEYLADLTGMRKVVLYVDSEAELLGLAATLDAHKVDHHVWYERPEDIPTAIALRPYTKSDVKILLKGLRLAR